MRLKILAGFLLLIAVDTFVQIGFKMAGNNTLPVTLDLPWIERVVNEPWVLAVIAGYGAAFAIYMTLIKHAPIGPAFAASHMEIVTVTLFSYWYFGDNITLVQALGCCAIVGGVLVLAATESGP
jgi:multidrug transporter EmrE-like cation transporter